MNKLMRSFAVGLMQLLLLAFLSADAFCREPNPPEIQALIGTKIPDDPSYGGPGRRVGELANVVEGWACLGGSTSREFGIESCYHRSGLSALIAYRRNPEDEPYSVVTDVIGFRSMDILVPYEVREKLGIKRGRKKQVLSHLSCETTNGENISPMVIAVGKPAADMPKNCPHFTHRISGAWRIDVGNMRLARYPVKDVMCWWNACLLEKDCQDEDQCNIP